MWNKIHPYIDSGKKLKISGDKLFAVAINGGFTGTITVHTSSDGQTNLGFSKGTIRTDKTPDFIAFSMKNALFSLSSDTVKNGEDHPAWQFFFDIINSYPAESLSRRMEKNNLRMVTIKPEAGEFAFLTESLRPYEDRPKIPLETFIKDGCLHEIYFLLITGHAALLDERTTKKEMKAQEKQQKKKEKDSKKSPEQKLRDFLKSNMKYRNIPSLFKARSGVSSKKLHNKYKELISVVHPDRLENMPDDLREQAETFAGLVNDAYKLLKDENTRKLLFELQEKFGDIRTPDDFQWKKELNILLNKANALYKVHSFGVAYKLFQDIYQTHQSKEILEKIILCDMKNRRPEEDHDHGNELPDNRRVTPEEKYGRVLEHIEEVKKFGAPSINIAFIEVEAHEQLGNSKEALRALNSIINMDRHNERAKQWKKRLKFYATH